MIVVNALSLEADSMVFPSRGCQTCRKRRVKVIPLQKDFFLPRANLTNSVIPFSQSAADVGKQVGPVPGTPTCRRGRQDYYLKVRMYLLKADPDGRGE